MPRDLPLSNGALLVAFDAQHQIRDLYYPHVGMENHAIGHLFRVGVWVDNRFSWLGDAGWTITSKYKEDSLVTDVLAEHAELALALRFREAVDFHLDVFVRETTAIDRSGRAREVRLFFTH